MTASTYTEAEYRLLLRAADLTYLGEIADWTTLRYVVRFNDQGSFELDGIPRVILNPSTGRYVANPIFSLVGPGTGLTVLRRIPPDGAWDTVTSGPFSIPIRTFSQALDGWHLGGPDDNHVLADRIVHPSPADLNFATQAYDLQAAVLASTAIIHFVNVNAGPGAAHPTAAKDRRTTGLTMASDPLVGSVISNQGRLQNLLALIQDIAIAGGDIGFKVEQDGPALIFTVYEPVDRSATILFSTGLGNLAEYHLAQHAPAGNYGFIGGAGDDTTRTFAEGGDAASIATWGRRVEFVVDRSDTADATQLGNERDSQLLQRQATIAVDLQPAETTNLRYGRDYNVGDLVSLVSDTDVVTDIIREVSVTVTREGEVVTPTVGTAGAGAVRSSAVFQKIRSLDERVRQQERH